MALRTRETILPEPCGYMVRSFVQYGPFPDIVTYRKTTVDEVDVGDNRNFDSEEYRWQGGRINYDAGPGTGMSVNFLADGWRNHIAAGGNQHMLIPDEPSDIALATTAAARTNPSRPYVDVPVEVLQLGDLTRLVQSAGRNLIRQAANANLSYQFGIKPIVDDITKIISFHEQVSRRAQEIERLRSSRGLRRTIKIGDLYSGEISYGPDGGGLIQSVFWFILSEPAYGMTYSKAGAHVRWKPSMDLSHLAADQMLGIAKKAVLGLTVDFSTVWELLPWSWLIDYAYNASEFFRATRNIVPAEISEISVTKTKRSHFWSSYREGYVNGALMNLTGVEETRLTKYRHRVDTISPVAHLPFLSANHMGILGSLAVTRVIPR